MHLCGELQPKCLEALGTEISNHVEVHALLLEGESQRESVINAMGVQVSTRAQDTAMILRSSLEFMLPYEEQGFGVLYA